MKRCVYNIISFVIILTFIAQNISWAIEDIPLNNKNNLHVNTLSPTSEFSSEFFKLASRIDLNMAGVGSYLVSWIMKNNINNTNTRKKISTEMHEKIPLLLIRILIYEINNTNIREY